MSTLPDWEPSLAGGLARRVGTRLGLDDGEVSLLAAAGDASFGDVPYVVPPAGAFAALPMAARILEVVDAWAWLTRDGDGGVTVRDACQVLRRLAGDGHLDAEVVAATIACLYPQR